MLKKILIFFNSANKKFKLDYLLVLVLALLLFSQMQSTFTLPEPDSFYHAKVAEYLSHGQILHKFPWLQATALVDGYVDHHFLFHLLLVPFVRFDDPLVGVKTATILFTSLAFLFIYWFLKKFKIRWPFVYIFILLLAKGWIFRASLVKAPLLFLVLLLFFYYFLAHKKKLGIVEFFGGLAVRRLADFISYDPDLFRIIKINRCFSNLGFQKRSEKIFQF